MDRHQESKQLEFLKLNYTSDENLLIVQSSSNKLPLDIIEAIIKTTMQEADKKKGKKEAAKAEHTRKVKNLLLS